MREASGARPPARVPGTPIARQVALAARRRRHPILPRPAHHPCAFPSPFRSSAAVLAAGCARQQQPPQILTPVRLDPSSIIGIGQPPAAAAPTADPFALFATTGRADWPGPNQYRSAQRRARARVLAAARRLHHRRHARHRARRHGERAGDHPLHQQLARHAALRLAAARPEPLPRRQQGLVDVRGRLALGRARLPGRLRRCATSPSTAASPPPKVDDTMMRLDLDAPLAPRGGRATHRACASLRGPRARLRPHGARQHALRDRAVVSAHGRLRRRARLEHRAVPRAGRVLPGVRRHRLRDHRARGLRGRRQRHAAEPGRGAHRRAARAARAPHSAAARTERRGRA